MSVCPTSNFCEFCGRRYPAEDDNCPKCPRCEVCGCTIDPDGADNAWGICADCEEHAPNPSDEIDYEILELEAL